VGHSYREGCSKKLRFIIERFLLKLLFFGMLKLLEDAPKKNLIKLPRRQLKWAPLNSKSFGASRYT